MPTVLRRILVIGGTAIIASAITHFYDVQADAKRRTAEELIELGKKGAYLKWDACVRRYFDRHATEFPEYTHGGLTIDEIARRVAESEQSQKVSKALDPSQKPSAIELACGPVPANPYSFP